MRRLLPTALVAATLALSGVASPPVQAEEPGVRVGAVGPTDGAGGYPSIHFGWYGLDLTFSDATPDGDHRYVATATEVGGEGAVVEQELDVWEGWDGASMLGYLPAGDAMQVGDTFEVVVSEYAGQRLVEQSAPVAHTLVTISHPEELELKRSGEKSVRVGEVVKLRWTGAYGEDVASVTQVVAARKKTFSDQRRDFLVCQNSYCPTKKGVSFVKSRSKELITRFRVPAHFAGKTLVISIYGQAERVDGVSTATPWGWLYALKVRR